MHQPDIRNLDELIALLEEVTLPDEPVSLDEAFNRYHQVSRASYRIVRGVLDEELKAHHMLDKCVKDMGEDPNSGSAHISAMILYGFIYYIKKQQRADPDQFKTDFINSLDTAVERLAVGLRKEHDTRTKQSAS